MQPAFEKAGTNLSRAGEPRQPRAPPTPSLALARGSRRGAGRKRRLLKRAVSKNETIAASVGKIGPNPLPTAFTLRA